MTGEAGGGEEHGGMTGEAGGGEEHGGTVGEAGGEERGGMTGEAGGEERGGMTGEAGGEERGGMTGEAGGEERGGMTGEVGGGEEHGGMTGEVGGEEHGGMTGEAGGGEEHGGMAGEAGGGEEHGGMAGEAGGNDNAELDPVQPDDPDVVDKPVAADAAVEMTPQVLLAAQPTATDLCDPDDVRICSDGSSVRPAGPNCEFNACLDGKPNLGKVWADGDCDADDVRICADGSSVRPEGPKCEVRACPDGKTPVGKVEDPDDKPVCLADVRQCPNGQTVSRQGPNCEFPTCPDVVCTQEVRQCADGSPMPRDPATCDWLDNRCPAAWNNGQGNAGHTGNTTINITHNHFFVQPPQFCIPCAVQPPVRGELVKIVIDERKSTTLADLDLHKRIRAERGCLHDQSCAVKYARQCTTKLRNDRVELTSRMLELKQRRRLTIAKSAAKQGRMKINTDLSACGCGKSAAIFVDKASDKAIVAHLVAAPTQKLAACYPRAEVLKSSAKLLSTKAVRTALPSVAVDTIRFGFNQAVIRAEEMVNVDRIGQWMEVILAQYPNEIFAIEGHTDRVGNDVFNQKLSMARAQAVKRALVKFYNVKPTSLVTVGFGKRFPVVNTEKPEKKNRRIVIRRMTPLVCKQTAAQVPGGQNQK
jgi:outer membrane protein OmpA-like peptidoglycan-associated protein